MLESFFDSTGFLQYTVRVKTLFSNFVFVFDERSICNLLDLFLSRSFEKLLRRFHGIRIFHQEDRCESLCSLLQNVSLYHG